MNQALIKKYLQRHEAALESILSQTSIPALRLREAIHYALFPGGKRIRPLLVYLTGDLLKINPLCLDSIAASIELIHCYSLIHDDLPAMDNDDLRRGKPSCHRAFNEATAILTGDGLQALAIEILLSQLPQCLPPDRVIAITRELLRACGLSGMVSGQELDLTELSHSQLEESRLNYIHSLKTGYLISACITMVLLTQETLGENADALQNMAALLGLVFQMQDDYLDIFGSPKHTGKDRASDLANEKTTFATLYSQAELAKLIQGHYERIQNYLSSFAEEASSLRAFIYSLEKRHLFGASA